MIANGPTCRVGGSPETDSAVQRDSEVSTGECMVHSALQVEEPLEEEAAEDPVEAELEEAAATADVAVGPPTPLTPLGVAAWACEP